MFGFIAGQLFTQASPLTQAQLQTFADNLDISVKVIDNLRKDTVSHIVRTTLHNNGSTSIPADGWTLFFHSMLLVYPEVFPKNKTVDLDIEKVQIGMVQGDLYFMRPIPGFVEIPPGAKRNYDITVALWAVSRTDFMPHWYLVSDDSRVEPCVVSSTGMDLNYVQPLTDPRQWKRATKDRYNPYTAQHRMRLLGFQDSGKASTRL